MPGSQDRRRPLEVEGFCWHNLVGLCCLHCNTLHFRSHLAVKADWVSVHYSRSRKTIVVTGVMVVMNIVAVAHPCQNRSRNCYSEVERPYGWGHLDLLKDHEDHLEVESYQGDLNDQNILVLDSEVSRSRKNTVVLVEEGKVVHRWSIAFAAALVRIHRLDHIRHHLLLLLQSRYLEHRDLVVKVDHIHLCLDHFAVIVSRNLLFPDRSAAHTHDPDHSCLGLEIQSEAVLLALAMAFCRMHQGHYKHSDYKRSDFDHIDLLQPPCIHSHQGLVSAVAQMDLGRED
jgi:hypothetical protein